MRLGIVRRVTLGLGSLLSLLVHTPTCQAFGDDGHKIVALIAYELLTPAARAHVDQLLARDRDTLTAADFASRATWADRYRDVGRGSSRSNYDATKRWHFLEMQVDAGPNVAAACPPRPLPAGTPASAGGPADCVVRKIEQFRDELRSRSTSEAERVLALKFVMHLVGDLHQPLHVIDRHDHNGNATRVKVGDHVESLHSYWDRGLVRTLGRSPRRVARELLGEIGQQSSQSWRSGSVEAWAADTFEVGRTVVYSTKPDGLDSEYQNRARQLVRIQLQKAGVRLAAILNGSLE